MVPEIDWILFQLMPVSDGVGAKQGYIYTL